ncbi:MULTISPECIES: hypothetical protein [Mycobacterium]|uniref:hypothetical protein n=1 Tax=Mycobacterium TaxID=1763 RepID=UPI00126A41B4|nr:MULTISPECIES: hypothetical protein [Mycobacterium]MCV7034819.1 hypothetical protein [Mycobacterium heckeshornense]
MREHAGPTLQVSRRQSQPHPAGGVVALVDVTDHRYRRINTATGRESRLRFEEELFMSGPTEEELSQDYSWENRRLILASLEPKSENTSGVDTPLASQQPPFENE